MMRDLASIPERPGEALCQFMTLTGNFYDQAPALPVIFTIGSFV